jgi:hypothetical protein
MMSTPIATGCQSSAVSGYQPRAVSGTYRLENLLLPTATYTQPRAAPSFGSRLTVSHVRLHASEIRTPVSIRNGSSRYMLVLRFVRDRAGSGQVRRRSCSKFFTQPCIPGKSLPRSRCPEPEFWATLDPRKGTGCDKRKAHAVAVRTTYM